MSQIIRQAKPVDARRQTNILLRSLENWLTFFLRDYELGSRRLNKHWGKKTSFSSCSSIIQMNKDICHIKYMRMSLCVFSVLCVWVCTHVYVCFCVFMYGCTQKCMFVCISASVHRSVLHLYSCECVCMSVRVQAPGAVSEGPEVKLGLICTPALPFISFASWANMRLSRISIFLFVK